MDEARRKADEYGITLFTVPTYYSSSYRRSLKGWYYKFEHLAVRVLRGLAQRPLSANWMEMRYRLSGPLSQVFSGRYTQRCFEPWRTAVLHANGEVVPCSLWHGGPMGTLQSQGFADIWSGEQYRRLRAELTSGNLREGCRACPAYSSDHRYRIN
jgi:radical SAM protein with 4Fe4S-binding SPASM domain